ncbi:MAG: hypothetical protein U9Q62_08660 [Campylobacterota bacterium]|nr:hypothetical protein [Campylobacterota bacterium]
MKFLLSTAIVISSLFGADMTSSSIDGTDAANSVRTFFSSDFTDTINKPMTSDASMQTVDGGQTFDGVNITCAAALEGEYLRVEYLLEAGSEMVPISRLDTDLDGAYDTQTISFQNESGGSISSVSASGLCVDGIVSCTPGTWSDCDFYEWQFDGSVVILQRAMRDDLSTCQCTNEACGSAAALQKYGMLNIMSEGIFQKVFSGSPDFVVSNVQNDGTSVMYYGQDNSACNTGVTPTTYTGSLENKGELARQDALLDPNSAYSVLQDSAYSNETSQIDKTSSFLTSSYTSEYISAEDEARMDDRQASIYSSTSSTQIGDMQAFSYTDQYVDENGNTITTAQSSVAYGGGGDTVLFCQVEWQGISATVFSDKTNASDYASAREMVRVETRECVDGSCPVNAGEAIKHSCGPISNFPEVVVRMEAAHEATKDMICSTD